MAAKVRAKGTANSNGIDDGDDIAAGSAADCDLDGTPDECQLPPLGYEEDCNSNGVLDSCELEANDCNGNSTPDDCDIGAGQSEDCDGNGVPDECHAVPVPNTPDLPEPEDSAVNQPVTTQLAWSGLNCCDLLYGAADDGYYAGSSSLFLIDRFTGLSSRIGPIGYEDVSGLASGPDGVLYGVGYDPEFGGAALLTVDPASGIGETVGPIFFWDSGHYYPQHIPDISFNDEGVLYAYYDCDADGNSNPHRLLTIDTATGAAEMVGYTNFMDCPLGDSGSGIGFANGMLYAVPYKSYDPMGLPVGDGPANRRGRMRAGQRGLRRRARQCHGLLRR